MLLLFYLFLGISSFLDRNIPDSHLKSHNYTSLLRTCSLQQLRITLHNPAEQLLSVIYAESELRRETQLKIGKCNGEENNADASSSKSWSLEFLELNDWLKSILGPVSILNHIRIHKLGLCLPQKWANWGMKTGDRWAKLQGTKRVLLFMSSNKRWWTYSNVWFI